MVQDLLCRTNKFSFLFAFFSPKGKLGLTDGNVLFGDLSFPSFLLLGVFKQSLTHYLSVTKKKEILHWKSLGYCRT